MIHGGLWCFSLYKLFFFSLNQKQTFFPLRQRNKHCFPTLITPFFCPFCEQTFYCWQFAEQTTFSSLFAEQPIAPHLNASSCRPLTILKTFAGPTERWTRWCMGGGGFFFFRKTRVLLQTGEKNWFSKTAKRNRRLFTKLGEKAVFVGKKIACSFAWGGKKVCFWLLRSKKMICTGQKKKKSIASPHVSSGPLLRIMLGSRPGPGVGFLCILAGNGWIVSMLLQLHIDSTNQMFSPCAVFGYHTTGGHVLRDSCTVDAKASANLAVISNTNYGDFHLLYL